MLRDGEIEPNHQVGAGIAALLGAIVMAVSASACVDHKCPKGYWQEGDTCYRIKDAGAGDSSIELEMDAEPATRADGSGDDAEQEPADARDSSDADALEAAVIDAREAAVIDSGACTGSDCPECDDGNPCTGEHELCVGNECVVQPYCGDGKKGADEECDPMHPAWSAWSCNEACKITTLYTACGGNPEEPQGGCSAGEQCIVGWCYRNCNVPGDCPAGPPGAATATCYFDVLGMCMLTDCESAADCPPGLVCIYHSTLQKNVCNPCSQVYTCPEDQECKKASSNDKFPRCM